MIPREGGNTYSGQFYTGYSSDALAADHTSVPSAIADRASSSEGNTLFWDLNAAYGGPIVRDKFWFFMSSRRWQVDKPITGSFYRNMDGTWPRYFDPSPVKLDGKDGRELLSGIDANTITSGLLRLTYQAERVEQVLGLHGPDLQGPLPAARRRRRPGHRAQPPGLAHLLHRVGQVDFDA